MSSQQHPSNSLKSLSFDDICKHFSSPLADAAADLGVCASVLKRVCRENGLERWPYRKVLSGKSVEDVKKLAARRKKKEAFVMQMINKKSGSDNKSSETSKQAAALSRTMQQQNQWGTSVATGGLPKGVTVLDEFKNGFPQDGLSVASNRWWGSINSGDETETEAEAESEGENGNNKSDSPMGGVVSMKIDDDTEKNNNNDIDSHQGTCSLTALRDRAAVEGREALNFGVFRSRSFHEIRDPQKNLLLQIFNSSFPEEWTVDGSIQTKT